MKPLDVAGILERAGADASAPEGSQAWALAQVAEAMPELIKALHGIDKELVYGMDHAKSSLDRKRAMDRAVALARAALARFEATP